MSMWIHVQFRYLLILISMVSSNYVDLVIFNVDYMVVNAVLAAL